MWDDVIDVKQVKVISLRGKVYFGVGAVNSIGEILGDLKSKERTRILVVTGHRAYKLTGAWQVIEAALVEAGFKYAVYDGVTPNPTAEQVDTAVKLGRSIDAQAVISIGGGSAIDAGKSAAVMMKYPDRSTAELFRYEFTPTEALPNIAVNLTHGTGSECNRFAVVSMPDEGYKPAIAYDILYPMYAIDDPGLMAGLSPAQTQYVSIDAVNHVIEAATTKSANPLAAMLATETVRLVVKYLPVAEKDPKNLQARYFLAYAALIAGWAFDNCSLHYTHALEHPLSALKPELAHGLGLAMLLPAVIEHIWPECGPVLSRILAPIATLEPSPKGAKKAAHEIEKWLAVHGASEKLDEAGFELDDVEKLTGLAIETPSLAGMLSEAPNLADRAAINTIYLNSLKSK